MNAGRTVFSQLIEHLPHKEFQKCVVRYGGDRYAKDFSCWDQYLAMAFAQLTLRRVSYFDAITGKRLVFLTNNFTLPALTIAQIYKKRWAVELFFRWIKQHLRVKAFYGTSENAVKTQIWIAVSIYVLVAIVRKRLGLEASLYQILQTLSLTQFEKTPILHALQMPDCDSDLSGSGNQLILFDF
jgi:hypothetical protein